MEDEIIKLKNMFRDYTKYVKPTSADNRVFAHNAEAEIYAKCNSLIVEAKKNEKL